MTDFETYGVGGVSFPLTPATTNSALVDADPVVHHIAAYFAAVLDAYLGDRLAAQAALEGLSIASAVATSVTIDPSPFLLAHHFRFPLLAVYRRSDTIREKTAGWEHVESVVEFAWVLPPLTPRQANELEPFLHAAARILPQRVRHGRDSAYLAGASVWAACGVEKIQIESIRYGAWEALADNAELFRAIVGTMRVWERDGYETTDFQLAEGPTSIILDLTEPNGSQITEFVEVELAAAPTLASIAPTTGPLAGGTTVTLTGTGFVPGTTPRVLFGLVDATGVVVINATTMTAVTPARAAYPTEAVGVQVVAADGQESAELADAFTYADP